MLKKFPTGLRDLCAAKNLDFCIKDDGVQISNRSLINPNVVLFTWKQVSEMTAEQLIESYIATDKLTAALKSSWDPERDRAVAQEFAERFPQPPRPKTRKGKLTFEQQIIAAYLHYVEGIEQQVIAVALVTNSGRVNEACKKIKDALSRPPAYRTRVDISDMTIPIHAHSDEDDE
jgi:hypothetical protein